MAEFSLGVGEPRAILAAVVAVSLRPDPDGELSVYAGTVGGSAAPEAVVGQDWVRPYAETPNGPRLRIRLADVPPQVDRLELRWRPRTASPSVPAGTRLVIRAGQDDYFSFGPVRVDPAPAQSRLLELSRSGDRWTAVLNPGPAGPAAEAGGYWHDNQDIAGWPVSLQLLAESVRSRFAAAFPDAPPFAGVAVALDASASMKAAYLDGTVARLLGLALATSLAAKTGERIPVVRFDTRTFQARTIGVTDADTLVEAASGTTALGSGSLHAPALRHAASLLGTEPGLVLVVTDGPPPDLGECRLEFSDHPSITWLYTVIGQTSGELGLAGAAAARPGRGAPGHGDFDGLLRDTGQHVALLSATTWMAVDPDTIAGVLCRRLVEAGTRAGR